MTLFKSTTFGKISGKHGTAVAALRKDGKNILKVFRKASNPDTLGQKNQRGKFAFVMKELNCLRSVLTLTFGSQYGLNKVVSASLKTAVVGEFPDFKLDYAKLILSNGTLNNTSHVSIHRITASTVSVKWSTEIFSNSSPVDHVNLVFLNQTLKSVLFKQKHALRNAGIVNVELPLIWIDNEIHAWIYFTSSNESLLSTSQFICTF